MNSRETAGIARFSRVNLRLVIFVLLLLYGTQLWLVVGHGIWLKVSQTEALAIAILLMIVPPIRRRVVVILDRLRHLSPRTRLIVAVSIAPLASLYLWFSAWRQGRVFILNYHDEFMYRLQTTMMAHGRLWMPPHPLADFFDTFYVFIHPVYAAQSFPGSAILFAPGVWLRLPFWVFPVIASGAIVGLVYWLIGSMVDGVAALCAALMLLGVSEFRRISPMYLSQIPALFIGLWMLVFFVQWKHRQRPGWTFAIGAAAGWLAITRPLDALCFALPVGVAMLIELRGRLSLNLAARVVSLLVAGAAPFICVQLIFNRGVTGNWLQTPLSYYNDREQPGVGYGFRAFDPNATAPSPIPQKRLLYDIWIRGALQNHTFSEVIQNWPRKMFANIAASILPAVLLLTLVPLAFLAPRLKDAWPFIAPLIAIVLYAGHPVFGIHYMFVVMPAAACIVVLGATAVAKRSAWAGNTLMLCIAAISIGSMPEMGSRIHDQLMFHFYGLERIEHNLRALPPAPSIVLFRFHPDKNLPEEEPVYNTETCWPDDAQMIRAHDLGPRNIELFRYYAQRQPQREVYLYDRGDDSLRHLGTVKELADRAK